MIKSLIFFAFIGMLIYFVLYPLVNKILSVLMWIPDKIFGNPYDMAKEMEKVPSKPKLTADELAARELQYRIDKLKKYEMCGKVNGIDWDRIVTRLDSNVVSQNWRDRDVDARFNAVVNTSVVIISEEREKKKKKALFNQAVSDLKAQEQADIVQDEIDSEVKQKLSKEEYRKNYYEMAS